MGMNTKNIRFIDKFNFSHFGEVQNLQYTNNNKKSSSFIISCRQIPIDDQNVISQKSYIAQLKKQLIKTSPIIKKNVFHLQSTKTKCCSLYYLIILYLCVAIILVDRVNGSDVIRRQDIVKSKIEMLYSKEHLLKDSIIKMNNTNSLNETRKKINNNDNDMISANTVFSELNKILNNSTIFKKSYRTTHSIMKSSLLNAQNLQKIIIQGLKLTQIPETKWVSSFILL